MCCEWRCGVLRVVGYCVGQLLIFSVTGFGGARLGRHVCGGGIGGVVDHLRRGADIGAGLGGTRLGVSKNGARSTPFW
uniref:Uncharacterized protein n=1 Tax=Physcomitrium patens TaxID=3218 RepID=A0A2K1K5X7_PHYPA|nr:hypothetical protein PHYPA_011075 [Physcomitrium patens]